MTMTKPLNTDAVKYLCVDTETTGLDSDKHALLEIGAIVLNKHLRPQEGVDPFRITVRPVEGVHEIEAKAIHVNNHKWVYEPDSEAYQAAYAYPEACQEFHEFLTSVYGKPTWIVMVGWNVGFDEDFLKALYTYTNTREGATKTFPWPFHYHKIDLLGICRYLDIVNKRPPRKSYSLDAMAKHFYGHELAKFAMHTAMGDAQMSLKVLDAMEKVR